MEPLPGNALRRRAFLLALAVGLSLGGQSFLAASGSLPSLRLGFIPPRVRPGTSLPVEVRLEGAPPGPVTVSLIVLLANWVPLRQQVPLEVGEDGRGSATVNLSLPDVRRRTTVDIVLRLETASPSAATARMDIMPLPSPAEMAALARGKTLGVLDSAYELQDLLHPIRPPVLDLGGLPGLRGFTGDIIALHTPSGERISQELLSAVAGQLKAGRSVVWFAGGAAFEGERFFRAAPLLEAVWPFRLYPGEALPSLQAGDFIGWRGQDLAPPAPFESCWPTARLIWAPDASLREAHSPTGDPAANWLIYDLFKRVSLPAKPAQEPSLLPAHALSGTLAASREKNLLPLFDRDLDPTRPLLLSAHPDFIEVLTKQVPDWTSRVKEFLDKGGRVLVLQASPESLSFLKAWGLAPLEFQPAPSGSEVLLRPASLLWGISAPAFTTLGPRQESKQPVDFQILGPGGSKLLVSSLQVGKGKVILCQFDPARAESGETIIEHLLRNMAVR